MRSCWLRPWFCFVAGLVFSCQFMSGLKEKNYFTRQNNHKLPDDYFINYRKILLYITDFS